MHDDTEVYKCLTIMNAMDFPACWVLHAFILICKLSTNLSECFCQDPACQATASSVRVGPGQIWIGLGLRFLRGAHLLFSPTLNVFHMARVPRRKTSFHCVYVLGHNLAFVLS